MLFRDRTDAGRRLAEGLSDYVGRQDVTVQALSRGGVLVAYEVAGALGAPLDIFLVRKLGVSGQKELATGAIATGGVRVVNESVVDYLPIPGEVIDAVAGEEQRELVRRERAYRGGRRPPEAGAGPHRRGRPRRLARDVRRVPLGGGRHRVRRDAAPFRGRRHVARRFLADDRLRSARPAREDGAGAATRGIARTVGNC